MAEEIPLILIIGKSRKKGRMQGNTKCDDSAFYSAMQFDH